MVVGELPSAIIVALLLTSAAAANAAMERAATGSSAVDGRDLASKLGVRRFLQDDNCIPPRGVCCSNCGWFEHTNCCDPNTVCSFDPIDDPGYGQDHCMPRNWDDIPKYFPELFP